MNYLEKRKLLPDDVLSYLSSEQIRWETERVCFLYKLTTDLIKHVTKPIGLLFVGDYKLAEYPKILQQSVHVSQPIIYGIAYEVNKRIFNKFPEYFIDSTELLEQWARLKSAPLISEDEAWKKVLELEPWILENKKEEQAGQQNENAKQQTIQASLIELTIFDAMKNYPEIGEQLITSEKIKLRSFPDPVRPSIKNWLTDYAFTVGFDNKDSIKRGNYLFHSTNTSRLSSDDRQRLAYILKANDEKTPVMVNKDLKQIIFSATNTAPEQKKDAQISNSQFPISNKNSNVQNSNPNYSASLHNTISYSSPQKLSYERETPTPVKSAESAPASQELNGAMFPYYRKPHQMAPTNNIVRLEPKPEPPKEMPKNIVNLRD